MIHESNFYNKNKESRGWKFRELWNSGMLWLTSDIWDMSYLLVIICFLYSLFDSWKYNILFVMKYVKQK